MSDSEKTTIQTVSGPVQVCGFRVARYFIIHDAIGEQGVAVTHAATGFRAFVAPSIEMAIEVAKACQRIGDIWGFTDPSDGNRLGDSHGEQLRTIHAAVLEGSIEKVRRFHNAVY